MTELLVLALCLTDYACEEGLKAYRSYNPAIKQYERRLAKDAERILGKEATVTIATFYIAAENKKIRLRLGQGFIFTGNMDEYGVQWRYEF